LQTLNAKWTVVCIGAAAYSADMASAVPTRIDPAVAARRPLRLLERAQPLQRAQVRPAPWHTRLGRWVDRLLLS